MTCSEVLNYFENVQILPVPVSTALPDTISEVGKNTFSMIIFFVLAFSCNKIRLYHLKLCLWVTDYLEFISTASLAYSNPPNAEMCAMYRNFYLFSFIIFINLC